MAVLIGAVLLAGVGYLGWKYQHSQWLLKNPTAAAEEEAKHLLRRVGRLVVLPEGEAPTIATISDASKLSSQQFFARSKTGDKVLVYTQSGRAILYRPDIDRVIETTMVMSPTPTPEINTIQIKEGTLAIYNGTETQGLATVVQQKLVTMDRNVSVKIKQNSHQPYTKTQVVVINPQAGDLGNQLAEALKISITANLPTGEDKPESDLLLILGSDYLQ